MLEPIRPATSQEVEELIKAGNCDIMPGTVVVKMGEHTAVLRTVLELDPLLMAPGASDREKAIFIWGIENFLRCSGTLAYYFNLHTDDETWNQVVESWGAKKTSTAPEFRFKKAL